MRSKAVAPIIASFLLTSIACSSGDGGTTEERLCVSLVRLAASQPSSVKVSRIQTDVGNPPKVTTVEFTMSGGQSERASCFYEPGHYQDGGSLRESFPYPFYRFCTARNCAEGHGLRAALNKITNPNEPLLPQHGPGN
jgi:hypothetical protein